MNIVWDPDSTFLSRLTRGWANISSALERLLVLSKTSFSLESLANKCRKVCAIISNKCELYIGTQSFTEFLLLAGVSADVIRSIAR